ncbi:MAG: flagellar biosynthesis protein FlhB [Synergistaceae bacterium]|jgi:flagellar biosynthetic protein FlhB|nr:flagellar biosynthesis protein FlhB [Synergistaceae bacterium]
MNCRKFFDIQFFAEERTEPATPRKRQKSREEGQMAKSQDLSAAVVIISGLLAVYLLGVIVWQRLILSFSYIATHLSSNLMKESGWWVHPLIEGAKSFFIGWLPIGVICALCAAMILIYQVGFLVTTKPLTPKPDRLNPISGLKKIISMRTIVELLKGILKALVLLGMLFLALRNQQALLLSIMMYPLEHGAAIIMTKIWSLALQMAIILLTLGLFDYVYQKWEFEKSIKMSKQEIKEEYKQMEGDPLIKRRIRQKQRELAAGRMMADVPKSDVIITNPTQIAIAIQYDQKTMSAPTVVAKGEGFIAQKIRDIANEHDIPIVENKPLARAIMSQVEVGESIPEDLYRAVAEILAFVYRLKERPLDWLH